MNAAERKAALAMARELEDEAVILADKAPNRFGSSIRSRRMRARELREMVKQAEKTT